MTEFNTYDEETGLIILKPGVEYEAKIPCSGESVPIQANTQGFRDDKDYLADKPSDVFRIAIIGDSYVEARYVPLAQTFYKLIETKLNQAGLDKKIEIYAVGKGGNGTFKNYLYLNQYALKYNPDLVILAFLTANDFRNDYELKKDIFNENGKVREKLSLTQKFSTKSVLWMWLDYKWQVIKMHSIGNTFRKIFAGEDSKAQVPFDFQVFLEDSPSSWDGIWDMEKNLISQFKEKTEEKGVKFVLVSLSDMWRSHPELLAENEEYNYYLKEFNFDFDKPEKILADFARENRFPYLNLTPVFREKIREEGGVSFVLCDGHWNETGNFWAAESISQFLLENKENLLNNQLDFSTDEIDIN